MKFASKWNRTLCKEASLCNVNHEWTSPKGILSKNDLFSQSVEEYSNDINWNVNKFIVRSQNSLFNPEAFHKQENIVSFGDLTWPPSYSLNVLVQRLKKSTTPSRKRKRYSFAHIIFIGASHSDKYGRLSTRSIFHYLSHRIHLDPLMASSCRRICCSYYEEWRLY